MGLHARDLDETKRIGAGRAAEADRGDQPHPSPRPVRQHLLERHHPRAAETGMQRDDSVERQQRSGEVAIGRRGKQIAADGRRGSHRGAADAARRCVQIGQVTVRQHHRHGDARAELDLRTAGVHRQQHRIERAQQGALRHRCPR